MYSIKNNLVYITFFCTLGCIRCLVELSAVQNDDIATTEKVIQETVINLFTTFRIQGVSNKPRIKVISKIHNFFVKIAIKDCNNLKRIAQLAKVSRLDNNTLNFIANINEVLNEGDKSVEESDVINVNIIIEKFINKLRDIERSYKFSRNLTNYTTNAKVLEYRNKSETIFSNITNKGRKENEFDNNTLANDEIWKPTERSGRRIYNGHRTRIKHYPFMASIQFFSKFQCGGSIIQKDLVITAASCLQLAWNNRFFRENPSFLSVQVGSEYYEAGGESIPVIEIYFHPHYTPKTLNNNLAVLRLQTHIVFSKKQRHVKRIEIDRIPSPLPANVNNIIIIGWGAKDRSSIVNDPWENKLSFAELEYYPLADCQEVYSKEYVTRRHFCAGFFNKGGGACQRDVGGPGLSGGILVGVISFGPPICGTPDAPTVFTKLGFYKNWIDSIMKMDVPAMAKVTTLRTPRPQTIDMNYSHETPTTFRITPITKKLKKINKKSFDVRTKLSEKILQILEDDNLFNNFLSTMFTNDSESSFVSSDGDKKNVTKVKTNKVSKKRPVMKLPNESEQHKDENAEEFTTQPMKTHTKRKKLKSKIKILPTSSTVAFLNTSLPIASNVNLYEDNEYEMNMNTIRLRADTKAKHNKTRKTTIKSTISTVPDEMEYEYEDIEEHMIKTKEIKSTTARKKKQSNKSTLKGNKDHKKSHKPFKTLSATKFKLTNFNTTPSLRLSQEDMYSEEETEQLAIEIKSSTPNIKVTKKYASTVKEESDNDNLKFDKSNPELKVGRTKSMTITTTVPITLLTNDEYIDDNEEEGTPKVRVHSENTKSINAPASTDKEMSNDEELKLEKDIADLLDDLDLRKLLDSGEPVIIKQKNKEEPLEISKENVSPQTKTVQKSEAKEAQIDSYSYIVSSSEDNARVPIYDSGSLPTRTVVLTNIGREKVKPVGRSGQNTPHDVSYKVQSYIKDLNWFKAIDNAYFTPQQPIESIKQILYEKFHSKENDEKVINILKPFIDKLFPSSNAQSLMTSL